MGHRGASLPHHPAQYVFTCCCGGTKRSREIHPLRLPAKPTQARSLRELVCHMAGGLPDLPERNLGLIPWGISAKEVTRPATMQALAERGSYSGHLVLTNEWLQRWGVLPCRKKINMVQLLPPTSHSANQKFSPGLMRGEASMTRPPRGQGSPQVGFRSCPLTRAGHQEVEQGSGEYPTLMPLQS